MTDNKQAEKPVAMLFAKTTRKNEVHSANKIIYGWPKTGKSTIAAAQKSTDGREPLFIATEDGHGALEVYVQRVTTWEGFSRLCDHLLKNAETVKAQHSCLVLDLITDLDQWCGQYIAKKNNVAHLSDLSYGKGFSLSKEEFQTQLVKLMSILPVTMIAHAAERETPWNGETIKAIGPSLSKGALDWCNGKVDMVGFISPANSKKDKAYLNFRPEKGIISGSRFPELTQAFEINYANPQSTIAAIQTAFTNAPVTTQKGESK